ncbi:YafY family transcriptional regulator [Termitidicoccus mucosus]|uniref:Transcriptional regulator n=1 Tax=Termitidicoccus mucosus TaxID=1184151 RepID=A0A178IIZ2_9BACT|nr:transcriptional regulator [Opitutaceae bacterium TSB47]
MNRVDRLLAQILLLQSRRVITAGEMARHFGLSVRTVYRDLAALGEAGVPIVAEAGVGYALRRGYLLPPVNFTPGEAHALAVGGLLVERFTDASVATQMRSAVAKVRAVLPRGEQDRLSRLERALATTASPPRPPQASLDLIQRALSGRQVLQFFYQGAGRDGPEPRTVEPQGLIHYLERWHLIAWCRTRGAYRDFRTDRMSEVRVARENFAPRADFDLAGFMRETMPAPTLQARIRFAPLAADRVKREWWQGIMNEQPGENGIVFTLAAVEWDRLVGWLLSFGTAATVLSPARLRKLLADAGAAAASHHKIAPGQPC